MLVDHIKIWDSCLRVIEQNISQQSFKTWFQPITPLKYSNNVLTIQVPSQFFYEWLEEHYVGLLREAITSQLGEKGRLEYSIVVDRGDKEHKPYTINLPTARKSDFSKNKMPEEQESSFQGPFKLKSIEKKNFDSRLNTNRTFDNFIEGDCNMLARSAGYAVANKPGTTSFNPLMVYGGVGLGKTHLIQAVGNKIVNDYPDKLVLYVTIDKFTNQFIDALKNNNVQDFTNFYLQLDVLIIDDIQFLSNREKTQDIFFNILDELHQNKKQLILSSDRPPVELEGIDDRLLSRFKWGLTADLKQPDFETRMAIIIHKMESEGIEIPHNVVEYLAYSLDTNVRELEGVLISLIAHSSLNNKPIDLELSKYVINNIVQEIDNEVGIDYIQKVVSEYFKVSIELMKDKTRKREVVIARQIAMYFSKEYTNHSLKTIGYYFGKRDHSTVIHAIQAVNDGIEVDKNIRHAVGEIEKKFKIKSIL